MENIKLIYIDFNSFITSYLNLKYQYNLETELIIDYDNEKVYYSNNKLITKGELVILG